MTTEPAPESTQDSLAAVGRSTFVLTGAALIIQIIGFARQLFLAAEVGITSELDALLIALAAPLALVGVLTAGVRTAIVPAYLQAKDEHGPGAARRLAGTVLVWTGLAGGIVSIGLWVFAAPVIAITGPGLTADGTAGEAVHYLQGLAPLAFLMATSTIFFSLCQAESLFPAIALAQVAGPSLTFAIMIATWDTLGLQSLVMGTLLGALVTLGIVAFTTIFRRVAPTLSLVARGSGLGDLVRHAIPLSASAGILEIQSVIDRAIASWLIPGGVSALRYGESLVRLPLAAVSPAWSQAVYPALVRARNTTGQGGLAGMTERIVRYALVFFVPLAGLTIAVAPVAVSVAYGRGSFTQSDVMLTATVVAVSAPLIVMWTVAPTLIAALNARRMGTIMLVAGIVNVVLQLVFDVLLGVLFGVVGVAMATMLSTAVVVLIFGRKLSQVEPTFSVRALGRTLGRASLAILPSTLAFGIPIWFGIVQGGIAEGVLVLGATGVAGLTSYYLIARRLGIEEIDVIVWFGRDTLFRLLSRLGIGAR